MFALGRLSKLILNGGGTVRFNERSNLLVFDPDSQDLRIVRPARGRDLDPLIDTDHERFHGHPPVRRKMVSWIPPTELAALGLIRKIHYFVPSSFNSEKADTEYKHAFGDFGDGDVSRSISLFPGLAHDPVTQHMYIIRRPKNRWTVDDFIRG